MYVFSGAVTALVHMADQPPVEIQRICARAVFNLTVVAPSDVSGLVNFIIPALVTFAKMMDEQCVLLGLRGILNLSCLNHARYVIPFVR